MKLMAFLIGTVVFGLVRPFVMSILILSWLGVGTLTFPILFSQGILGIVAGLVAMPLPKTFESGDIVMIQHGKHLFTAGFDDGQSGHGGSRIHR